MNPLRRRPLDRRTFLRGAGAVVALPWLDAMVPALSRCAPPVRAVFVFSPNGMKMDDWTPRDKGSSYIAPFLLEPVQEHRKDVLILSGLTLDGGRSHGDGPGDHARAAGSYLTCAHPKKTGGANIHCGTSVDQEIAGAVGSATPFASLELGMERGRRAGVCDSGYSCAYSNNIAWKTPTTPVAKETDPREVFTRLFGDPDDALDAEERARQEQRRRSVLDSVLADAKSLTAKLGTADRAKLDEYLTAVRELEQRLDQAEAKGPEVEVPRGLARPRGPYEDRLALMYELIALCLQTDRSRVVTFMLGNAGSNRSYRSLEVPEGHHDLSHHGGKKHKLAQIRKINRWQVEQFAAFLDRLAAAEDGGTSLLDQSMILFGSAIADGNAHRHEDLPVLLAGRAGGSLRGGRHLAFPRETPMANLYLGLMDRMGVRRETFADSKGRIEL